MKNNYVFVGDCRDTSLNGSYGEGIDELTSDINRVSIDSDDFIKKYTDNFTDIVDLISYANHKTAQEFTEDWSVDCNESLFQGVPCIYYRASGIEFIFVKSTDLKHIKYGEEAEKRQELITELEEQLDNRDDWQLAKDKKSMIRVLSSFVKENISTMKENNINLGSLFTGYVDQTTKSAIQSVNNKLLITDLSERNNNPEP